VSKPLLPASPPQVAVKLPKVAALGPLRNLVRRYETGALLLHHSTKSNGGYRRSSAIGASVELGFRLGPPPLARRSHERRMGT
jgi:hypothetical protein